MWNLSYSNKACYQKDKFLEHQKHLNKLLSTQTYLDLQEPYKPLFLTNKNNRTQNKINESIKKNYENGVLLKKIKKIEKFPSAYHPSKLKVLPCPAYEKTNFVRSTRQKSIDTENLVSFFLN